MTTVPSSLRMWLGSPSGPMKSRMASPSRSAIISKVVFPTAWITTVTVPRSGVEIGYGQRNALAVLVDASHDEVPGTRRARHIRRFHVPEEGRRTELFPTSDEKHHTPLQLS